MRLKRLSISALIFQKSWALSEIIQVVNTAPTIPDVFLRFDFHISNSITFLARLVPFITLDQLQIKFTGKCPRIDLCVTSQASTAENILDALSANKVLMDLVKRDLEVTLWLLLGSQKSFLIF